MKRVHAAIKVPVEVDEPFQETAGVPRFDCVVGPTDARVLAASSVEVGLIVRDSRRNFMWIWGGGASKAERVLGEAARAEYPTSYQFSDEPDAGRLLACSSARRAVRGVVDRSAGLVALSVDQLDETAAVVIEGKAFVRSDALPDWNIATDWVAVTAGMPDPVARALTTSLGSDLARYVLTVSLPDHPSQIAEAALAANGRVEFDQGDEKSDPVVLEVEVSATELDEATAERDDSASLRLLVRLNGQFLITEIRAVLAGEGVPATTMGQHISYDWSPLPTSRAVVPSPAETTPLDAVPVPASPRPPSLPCSIGP